MKNWRIYSLDNYRIVIVLIRCEGNIQPDAVNSLPTRLQRSETPIPDQKFAVL